MLGGGAAQRKGLRCCSFANKVNTSNNINKLPQKTQKTQKNTSITASFIIYNQVKGKNKFLPCAMLGFLGINSYASA